jgi:hypothetical protein
MKTDSLSALMDPVPFQLKRRIAAATVAARPVATVDAGLSLWMFTLTSRSGEGVPPGGGLTTIVSPPLGGPGGPGGPAGPGAGFAGGGLTTIVSCADAIATRMASTATMVKVKRIEVILV